MRISDWCSDVCSSDLNVEIFFLGVPAAAAGDAAVCRVRRDRLARVRPRTVAGRSPVRRRHDAVVLAQRGFSATPAPRALVPARGRSEEHTSELQSIMRISYAVCRLKKNRKEHNELQIYWYKTCCDEKKRTE